MKPSLLILAAMLTCSCAKNEGADASARPSTAAPEDEFIDLFSRKQDARLRKMAQRSTPEVKARKVRAMPPVPEPDFAMPMSDIGGAPTATPSPEPAPRR